MKQLLKRMAFSYMLFLIVCAFSKSFAYSEKNSYNYDYDEIYKDYPELNNELILKRGLSRYPNVNKKFAIQRSIDRFGPPFQEYPPTKYGNDQRINNFQNQRTFPNKKYYNNRMPNPAYRDQIYGNQFRMRDQTENFPPGKGDFPSEKENFPPENENFSPENESFPPGKRNFPPENENFPPENENFPRENESFLPENVPPENDNFPRENENYLPEIENFPPKNENFSLEDENFSPENQTETDPALPETEVLIKTSAATTASSVTTKSAKRAADNSKLSKRQRSTNVRNIEFKRPDSLGKWFDKEMSDVEPERYGNTDKPKAVESRETKSVKKSSRNSKKKSQETDDQSQDDPIKMWENTRRYSHLKRFAPHPNSEISPMNTYRQKNMNDIGYKRNVDIGADNVPMDYPDLNEIPGALDSLGSNEDDYGLLPNSQQESVPQNTFGNERQFRNNHQNSRPALREAPANQFQTLSNVADTAPKNIVVTVVAPLQESNKEKSNLIDKTNEVLSKEVLRSPNVEEKMQRVVENFRTKKTLVNDKRLQQETSVIENEQQKVNDNVHVKTEDKSQNKTETATETTTTYTTLPQDQYDKHFLPPDHELHNKNFLPDENFLPPGQELPNPDYDTPPGNIAPHESPYGRMRHIQIDEGIPQTDDENTDTQSKYDPKPISFKDGEMVVITTASPNAAPVIQSSEVDDQSATVSDGTGIGGSNESTTDLFNVSMPDIYLKEEKVEKQSKTLLRSKEAYRNKTAVVKGQRKSEIKNNKESFHEVFVEEKGEDKYPSRVEDVGKDEKKSAGFQNRKTFSDHMQSQNGKTRDQYPDSGPRGSPRERQNNPDDYSSDYQGGENTNRDKVSDYSYQDDPSYGDVKRGDRFIDNTARKSDPRLQRESINENMVNSDEDDSNEINVQSNIQSRAAGNVVYFPPTTTTPQYNDFLHVREVKSSSVRRRHLHNERP
ncbi:DNA ligase 1-like [Parasteatoda tepidariorum]|uniref:DNA ligase 1-like n=1 Tax=Parasteatoda tepidariorum TaxID=114398 RepID=UPI00077F824C|nr:uncharacterized protein LOC107456662 [Parasteatoda tepidariorum]